MTASHLLSSDPWYASPLAAFSLGLGGIILGVLGCLLTLWYARTRRRITYALLADTPLLDKSFDAGHELEVRVRGDEQPLNDPHVVVIAVRCQSQTDIRPGDFMGGAESLVIELGQPIVKAWTVDGQGQGAWPWTILGQDKIATSPTLIRAGARCEVTVLTDGPAQLSHRSELADVRVERVPPNDKDPYDTFFLVVGLSVLAGFAATSWLSWWEGAAVGAAVLAAALAVRAVRRRRALRSL